jgi:nitrogen-specific signal transduction histidine kinase
MQEESRSQLNDQIFQLNHRRSNNQSKYKFVMLKVNEIKDDESESKKILIQLIDMSDKILVNEQKAEQSFLTLINAAISHKLRNPLSSLIG